MLVTRLFAGMDVAVEPARKRAEVPVSIVDGDNAEIAERTLGSLAMMSYSQLMIEQRLLRMVAIDGISPSLEALEDGRYRYGRSFYLVVPAAPSAAAKRFAAFVHSADGIAALRQVHCLPGLQR